VVMVLGNRRLLELWIRADHYGPPCQVGLRQGESQLRPQNTPRRLNHLLTTLALTLTWQRVYDIIHPVRRNLTAIRGYKRLGGLPDDPHTDPQDKNWYGPHDRLFVPEEDEVLNFQPGPKYGESRDDEVMR
jgi:hypothetical protein